MASLRCWPPIFHPGFVVLVINITVAILRPEVFRTSSLHSRYNDIDDKMLVMSWHNDETKKVTKINAKAI